jgi:hypothetical protein
MMMMGNLLDAKDRGQRLAATIVAYLSSNETSLNRDPFAWSRLWLGRMLMLSMVLHISSERFLN